MPPLTDEQVKAILSIDEHVLVSAGAGSGKTFVLVERYIKVLEADNDASVADIIAVTYTRKAAEEMRTRLKARLKEIAANAEGETAKRWTKCLSEVESARIGTIHSLCESLLKNYPSEAGIDPGFEILDDLERAEILADSIDESLHYIIERTEDEFTELLEYPIEDLRKWIAAFMRSALKYKDSRQRLGDCSQEALSKFAEAFIEQDIARTLEEYVSDKKLNFEYNYQKDSLWKDPSSKIGLIQSELLSYLDQIFDKDGKSKAERWEALCSLAKMESARTSGGPAAKELRDSMKVLRGEAQVLCKSHSSALNQADQLSFTLLRALISVTDSALAKYEALKQQHQKLDFDDLIERCQNLVTNNKHALKQISKNLRAVLIDEFQDTNWTQAKLLIALAGEKAKLFLIGDDKQSIYKFQGADVGTFNACKIYIKSLIDEDRSKHRKCAEQYTLPVLSGTGQLMTLSQSFRSHPEIVNFVNHLFRTLFDATQDSEDYKSRFQALRPARTGVDDEDVRVDLIYTPEIDPETAERSFEIEKIESQLTAQWIKEKVESGTEIFDKSLNKNRKINYSDFAILLQANSDFAGIEKALSLASVPFVSIAGSGFLERQEVFDLENVLNWLICPQDSHALFAILRSPIFGFSDDILHDLKAGKPGSLWQCLNQKSREAGRDDLLSARNLLNELQRSAGTLPLPELLRSVVLKTGYDIVLLCTAAGKQKSRNVWKFLALASQNKHMGIAEFLQSLKSMRELGVKNLTDAPLSADNAVKIMTIHKSKGLEFSAVAMPKLGRGVHQKPDKILFGKDLSITLDCTRDKDEEKPAFFMAANNLSRRMDEEEKKRLLYVAVTRARDYLALFITPKSNRGTNFAKWLISSLGLPEPEGTIENETIRVGAGEDAVRWRISQPELSMPGSDAAEDVQEQEMLVKQARENAGLADYSLLVDDDKEEIEATFTPVPWEQLLRVCPADEEPTVHATIAGNYFHLLMGSLGKALELPSEKQRRALLSHHQVGVHDLKQQELLIKESELLLINFKNSKLYPLMKTARRRLEEQAYLIIRDGKEQEFRPDLIIEDSEGNWHIIDYKTDHFDLKQLPRQVKAHQAQLANYVEDLQSILGVSAKAWLYFAQHGQLEEVSTTAPVQLSLFQ